MTKILAHIANERLYSAILQNLGENKEIIGSVLHGNMFDTYHKVNPDTVIIPIHEYSQEFHEFVQQFKDKVKIIVYVGSVHHADLLNYFTKEKVKIITSLDMPSSNTILVYKKLYDSNIYKNYNLERNDKILVMLSNDLNKNHSLLDNILYPNTKLKICLTNNHLFKHKQNIGVTNISDLAIVLNNYGYFIDIDQNFTLEADACGIKNISVDGDLLSNINLCKCIEPIENIENYSISNFIKNQLLSFIEA